jgi:CxxC-x17-CxxC domain-containing protein
MEYEDQTIICSDCGQEFVFTAGEQQFYAERGFEHPPKRCKPCRAQRKQQASSAKEGASASGAPGRSPGPGRSREAYPSNQRLQATFNRTYNYQGNREIIPRTYQPRDIHITTCQACGVTTRVPFKPQAGRGVYCPECYQALKALARNSSEEETSQD